MKTIRKTMGCLSLVGLLLSGSTAIASQDPWVNGPKTFNWLYVIEASGKLVHDAGKHFHLVVPTKAIKSVLAFTDRPDRKVHRLSPQQFSSQVHSGSNSFDRDPPNAVISWSDKSHPAKAYEISSVQKNARSIRYQLISLLKKEDMSSPKAITGSLSLFIDDDVVEHVVTSYSSFDDCMSRNNSTPFMSFFMCWGWSSETYTQTIINGKTVG